MNKQKHAHTPLPWQIRATSKLMSIEGRFHQITCNDAFPSAFVPAWDMPAEGEVDGTEEALANAAFIVTACNSHYDLVDACLEFCRKVDAGEARSVRSYNQMMAALKKAGAA